VVDAQPPPTAAVGPAAARGATAAIEYRIDRPISAAQFVSVLRRSTLGERRPIDDAACIAGILEHANLTITAWDGHDLVGVARSLTDFHYTCYLSDLAVAIRYEGAGIGCELVRRTQGELGPRCTLRLVSAPAAMGYDPKLGFVPNELSWDLPPDPVRGSGASVPVGGCRSLRRDARGGSSCAGVRVPPRRSFSRHWYDERSARLARRRSSARLAQLRP